MSDDHAIDEIVENMASKLYFHGHPINRREARDELKLKANCELSLELETAMWDLYREYEAEFKNLEVFDVGAEIGRAQAQGQGQVDIELNHAMIESLRLTSTFNTERRYTIAAQLGPGAIQEVILWQGWHHSPAAPAESPN
jgi:hypothetical protein